MRRELVAGTRHYEETSASELTSASLKAELTKRGITDGKARSLLDELPEDPRDALRVIEWADREIERTRPQNPAGFMFHLIHEKVTPPEHFLGSQQVRALEVEAEAERLRNQEFAQWHAAYEEYRQQEIDKHIKALPRSEYEERIEGKKQELVARFDALRRSPAETVRQSAEHYLRHDIEKELRLVTFEEYCREHTPRSKGPEEPE